MVGAATYPRSDLFQYDRTALKDGILVHDGKSRIDYHEYAVFRPHKVVRDPSAQGAGGDVNTTPARDHTYSILSDGPANERLFDLAFKEGHGLNSSVSKVSSANSMLSRRLTTPRANLSNFLVFVIRCWKGESAMSSVTVGLSQTTAHLTG